MNDHQNKYDTLIKSGRETKALEYKERGKWDTKNNIDFCVQIMKSIIGMANTEGGHIVIGVRDNDKEPVGLNDDEYDSYDDHKLNQFINNKIDPKINIQVIKHKYQSNKFVIIQIPTSTTAPHLMIKDYEKLKSSTIYIRNDNNEIAAVSSYSEMDKVLNKALSYRLQNVLKWTAGSINSTKTNFYLNEIKLAEESFNDFRKSEDQLNSNKIIKKMIFYPEEFNKERLSNYLNSELILPNNYKLGEIEFLGTNVESQCKEGPKVRRYNSESLIQYKFKTSHGLVFNALFESGLFINITDWILFDRNFFDNSLDDSIKQSKNDKFIDHFFLARNIGYCLSFMRILINELAFKNPNIIFELNLMNTENSYLACTVPNRAGGLYKNNKTDSKSIQIEIIKTKDEWLKIPIIEIIKYISNCLSEQYGLPISSLVRNQINDKIAGFLKNEL